MKDDFSALWALLPATLRREPTPSELAGGFPCGALDQKLFNELTFRLSLMQREMVYAIIQSGQTPTQNDTTQLWEAISRAVTTNVNNILVTRNISGRRTVLFATPGSISWTPPTGCTNIEYEVVGGGAGGGGAANSSSAASGGGGGGYVRGVQSVTPGTAISGTVAAGGIGGIAGGGNGTNGGTSSLGGFATAGGGTGGKGATNGIDFSINPGGAASGGSIENRPGGGGSIGYQVGASQFAGGTGGPGPLYGGRSEGSVNTVGAGGAGPGGGGGGASANAAGGNGFQGLIRIYF